MKIKIGDTIEYNERFGCGPVKLTTIRLMELTSESRDKYGVDVEEVDIEMVKANRVVFSLDNNHWCYSDQVIKIGNQYITRRDR